MEGFVLLGRGHELQKVPVEMWMKHLDPTPEHTQTRLSFMTEAHHQVRYFVVRELVDRQKPIAPETIAETLNIPLPQVKDILDVLERKLFFLVRNEQGSVAWAYPMTVEETPHRLCFSTGERLYGA